MTRQISPLILQLLVLVLVLVASPVHACGYIYNDVFGGLPRDTSASIASVLSIPGMSPISHEMSQRQTINTPNTNDPLDSREVSCWHGVWIRAYKGCCWKYVHCCRVFAACVVILWSAPNWLLIWNLSHSYRESDEDSGCCVHCVSFYDG